MALSSCRTACLASGGCSGDSMSSTDFHTASTACWRTWAQKDFGNHEGPFAPLYPKYDSLPLTSSNFFVLASSHTWFNIRTRLLRPHSGWSSWKKKKRRRRIKMQITMGGGICVYGPVSSSHLDDVSCNDKLRRFRVTLFTLRPWWSQSKDPLHLVLETLFAWLFIHGLRLKCEKVQSWHMSARAKSNTYLAGIIARQP